MLTAKHSLMQMYGRTEGYLIQDMTDDQVTKSIIFNVERVHSSMPYAVKILRIIP